MSASKTTFFDPPTLDAYVRCAEGFLKAWCNHCGVWHLHGRGDGHRVAHCFKPGSPYDRSGYILRTVGKRYK